MLCALAACFLAMADAIPPELDAYLKRPEPSFAWSAKEPGLGALHLRMTSQTWRNVRWTHDIVVTDFSENSKSKDAAILYLTGGNPGVTPRIVQICVGLLITWGVIVVMTALLTN